MLNSIKRLLAKFAETGRGLEKLECSRGGINFRNRSRNLSCVACELFQNSIWIMGCASSAPGIFNVDREYEAACV